MISGSFKSLKMLDPAIAFQRSEREEELKKERKPRPPASNQCMRGCMSSNRPSKDRYANTVDEEVGREMEWLVSEPSDAPTSMGPHTVTDSSQVER